MIRQLSALFRNMRVFTNWYKHLTSQFCSNVSCLYSEILRTEVWSSWCKRFLKCPLVLLSIYPYKIMFKLCNIMFYRSTTRTWIVTYLHPPPPPNSSITIKQLQCTFHLNIGYKSTLQKLWHIKQKTVKCITVTIPLIFRIFLTKLTNGCHVCIST